MPHGAPGVKFYAFEGVDSGKEPIRVQRYLENGWRKIILPVGGVVSGGTPTPRSGVFFVRLHCALSHSFIDL